MNFKIFFGFGQKRGLGTPGYYGVNPNFFFFFLKVFLIGSLNDPMLINFFFFKKSMLNGQPQ